MSDKAFEAAINSLPPHYQAIVSILVLLVTLYVGKAGWGTKKSSRSDSGAIKDGTKQLVEMNAVLKEILYILRYFHQERQVESEVQRRLDNVFRGPGRDR